MGGVRDPPRARQFVLPKATVDEALRTALEAALDAHVLGAEPVAGGDVSRAHRLRCDDGRSLFLKTHANPPAGLYRCEADGLAWLAETGALRTPAVIAVRDAAPAFLVLEWIEPGPHRATDDEALGHGLAHLHRATASGFGLAQHNYIALLPQSNTARASWPEFYASERLEPLLRRAVERGLLDASTTRAFDRLFARLPALCGQPEPPARLHGDLWSGNVIHDARGNPVLIDPAVYAGHREVDLAMMRLFGGFAARCFAAYDEVYPLERGHEERVALYQLYPLLVHVNLFGSGYVRALDDALRRLL